MKYISIFISILIVSGCTTNNYCPVTDLYFQLKESDSAQLQSVIAEFAKKNKLQSKGSNKYALAYYERNQEESINFIVHNRLDATCYSASFYAHKTKFVAEASSIKSALLKSLKTHYGDKINIFSDENCNEKSL